MARSSVFLITFCFICLMFSESVINFHRFQHYPDLQHTVCNTDDVRFNVSAATNIACSAVCVQRSSCKSYMYNRGTGDCIGCSTKYSETNAMGIIAGYGYYENTTNNYNASCESTLDCNGKNMVCEETRLQCVCYPGYSYRPSNRSCVAGCEVYGNTYETYPNYKLKGLNNLKHTNSNLEDCANKCNTEMTYQCRSFELEEKICRLSRATALTNPEAVIPKADGDYYYNRNYNYNASCESALDCNGKNMICEKTRLQCVCYPGFSYKPSNRRCVGGCEVYGNTYETYPRHKLYQLNRQIFYKRNFEFCSNKCNTVKAYRCRAFEIATGECRLATATALSRPKAFVSDHNSVYYNRNCA